MKLIKNVSQQMKKKFMSLVTALKKLYLLFTPLELSLFFFFNLGIKFRIHYKNKLKISNTFYLPCKYMTICEISVKFFS